MASEIKIPAISLVEIDKDKDAQVTLRSAAEFTVMDDGKAVLSMRLLAKKRAKV